MIPSKQTTTKKGKKVAPIVSAETKITADKATNSLIIMAEKDDYMALEEIIKKLDIPRSMVYIECLIMEVNVRNDIGFGNEWMSTAEARYLETDAGVAFGSGGSTEMLGLLSGADTAGRFGFVKDGFSLGVLGETIEIGGVTFPTVAALARAYKTNSDVHILSTPQLITTDNEEATITVGQSIPFQTRSETSSTSQTFANYEYKDIGKTLKVTPQISKDGLVRLKISLEIQTLSSTSSETDTLTPSTLKRTIETTVIINNKNTIVIGGLIDDQLSKGDNSVPCIGDIPVFGWLFKTIAEGKAKTNLYFFLTPHVIKSPNDAEKVYDIKKENIEKAIQDGSIKLHPGESPLTDILIDSAETAEEK